jgi:hypothetical protein
MDAVTFRSLWASRMTSTRVRAAFVSAPHPWRRRRPFVLYRAAAPRIAGDTVVTGLSRLPPVHAVPGQIGSGISHEVSPLRPSTFTGPRRAVRRMPASGPSRFDVRASAGTHAIGRVVLAVFMPRVFSLIHCVAARAPFVAHVRVDKTPPARVIRGWCSSGQHTFRARLRAVLAAWSGQAPACAPPDNVPGICIPFAVSLRFVRVSAPLRFVLRRLGPTCRFASGSAASFIDRGIRPTNWGEPWTFGRGSWALAPQTSRTMSSTGPAMAFMHRVARIHRPGLPWVFQCTVRRAIVDSRRRCWPRPILPNRAKETAEASSSG